MMRTALRIGLSLALGWAAFPASEAAAQVIGQRCGRTFLSACATLHEVSFSGNTLTLIVSNTSSAVDHSGSFIGLLLLEFSATPPAFALGNPTVEYGTYNGLFTGAGQQEGWRRDVPSGQQGGFQIAWDARVSDNLPNSQGGASGLRLNPGEAARITIVFASDVSTLALNDWTGHLQGLAGGQSDWATVVPEPVSIVLLGSGLLGLGGVGFFRRRRDKGASV